MAICELNDPLVCYLLPAHNSPRPRTHHRPNAARPPPGEAATAGPRRRSRLALGRAASTRILTRSVCRIASSRSSSISGVKWSNLISA